MSWESTVNQLTRSSYPKEVYELEGRWRSVGDGLGEVSTAVYRLSQLTHGAGGVSMQPNEPGDTSGGWTGAGADAYRDHLGAIVAYVDDLAHRITVMNSGIGQCADALSTAVGTVPVAIFYDRDLPGGVDAEDIIGASNQDGDAFRDRVQLDYQHRQDVYADDGFRKRAYEFVDGDLSNAADWAGSEGLDGTAVAGRSGARQAGKGVDGAHWYQDGSETKKKIDTWHAQNTAVANKAGTQLAAAYADYAPSVKIAGARRKLPRSANVDKYGADPTNSDAVGTDGTGVPGIANGSFGTSSGQAGALSNSPYLSGPSDHQSPGSIGGERLGNGSSTSGDSRSISPRGGYNTTPNGDDAVSVANGSGLAGRGDPGELGAGVGPGGPAGGADVGGGSGTGGGAAGSIPGMVSSGSTSAGPGRSPMSPLTDPGQYLARQAEARATTGANGMPGMLGTGGRGGASSSEDVHQTWLTEDDDPWGLDSGFGESVIK